MEEIAFLIPCYNEELTIGKVIDDAKMAIPEATIYVYDNNCTDKTAEIAAAHGAIVRREPRQGKGNVIQSMFRDIDAHCYIMVDGDDTYELSSAREMADKILKKEADMVVGDRLSGAYYTENKRPFHNFGNNLVRGSVNAFFHGKIKDIMTGYRAFSYTFVKSFPVLSSGFEIETEMSIFALDQNFRVETMTIEYRDRPKGSVSKLNTFKDGFKVLRTIYGFHRKYKPFAHYFIYSLILFAVATGFIIPIFIDYAKTGQVDRFPTLIVCAFVYLVGILLIFLGMILNSFRKTDKMRFQNERNRLAVEERNANDHR
ncbi:MAG: glycosyltransferase family 2 protein [Bacilli bacterium]|nr:glycosyltransferase family 2 protein [Bacilli bacterium]